MIVTFVNLFISQSLCASPTTRSPKEEVPSPFLSTMFPQEMSTGPSSGGAAYGDNSSQLPREASLDALFLSHVSPVIQLAQFPPECSPDSSPEIHRRSSLHEEPLQPIYIDTEMMARYYEPDILYGVPPSSLQSPMYTADSSTMLARDTSTFLGDQVPHHWATNDAMLMSPHETVFSPAYGYSHSDSAESIDIYAPPSYPINTYDSFEFQALREHSTSAVLATQHA